MARFKYSNRILLVPIMIGLPLVACPSHSYHYTGDALAVPHPWLKGKRIFIYNGSPETRDTISCPWITAPYDAGLRVSLILEQLLKGAGASVETSMGAGSIAECAEKARLFSPDILIGIGDSEKTEGMRLSNRPLILIGGPRELHPSSFDFAVILLNEFRTLMDDKGIVAVDSAFCTEKGGALLRETSSLCPGVIGIPACYPGIDHSLLSGQAPYLEKLADAYFFALSSYFKRGFPSARVSFSCPVDTDRTSPNLIRDPKPVITLHTRSGADTIGIDEGSLRITLDGLTLNHRKIADNQFSVDYGTILHPGHHRLRFQFRNLQGQSSMILTAPFTVETRPEDRERLIKDGTQLIRRRGKAREGLAMLLSALSYGCARSEIDSLIREIIRGFHAIGDTAGASHFKDRLSLIYPISDDIPAQRAASAHDGRLSLIDCCDKEVHIYDDRCAIEKERNSMKKRSGFSIKKFFSGQ